MKKFWVIFGIIVLIIVILLILKSYFQISFEPLVSNIKLKKKSVFEQYIVKEIKIGDDYGVFIENVVATSADLNNRHIKIDLYIITVNKNVAKLLSKNNKQTAITISNILTNFKISDLITENGKKFLKNEIKRALELKYGKGLIKEIYFHNMVFS
ncbi:flagellar basal body-associated FliL family protein [Deferribacter thermophilus]|uniref:flagellar basal body-associated FliL family protein n=1 Tax=Deferribacter thermophilus TaxID=53573 RepID=UPI003C208EFB